MRTVQRTQTETRPLRRIAKRLGVYTTTVRLDATPAQRSFARMTSDQLMASADALGAAMRTARGAAKSYESCASRCGPRSTLAYLLEPLRAYADIEEPSTRVAELRAWARAAGSRGNGWTGDSCAAGVEWRRFTPEKRCTPRSGRRARQPWLRRPRTMVECLLRRWSFSAASSYWRRRCTTSRMHAFDALTAVWQETGGDASIERITAIAAELQG